MCGIIGYIGNQQAAPILLDGLTKLEYRGYDSAGIAVYHQDTIQVVKTCGRLQQLRKLTEEGIQTPGLMGIGHTRWATHGKPSDLNSHPHISGAGKFAVVHNGIIENYSKLRDKLIDKGYHFVSETDTEVISHLAEYYYQGDLLEMVFKLMDRLEGSYAIGIMCKEFPDQFLAVRKDSPLVIGLGEGEHFIASDITALLPYTRKIYHLEEQEVAIISSQQVQVYNKDYEEVQKEVFTVDWDVDAAEKGGYEHFMFKEMMEQPKAIQNTISPRIKEGQVVLDQISFSKQELEQIKRIYIVACGSAYHVGMVGKYMLEELTRIPVEVDLASEFRYRRPVADEHCLVIVVSQSGETADSLAALREAKRLGCRTLSIVNVVGSSIANESDDVIYTWAGPEIAVATTKAYSTQLTVIYLIAMKMAETLGSCSESLLQELMTELNTLPEKIQSILDHEEKVQYFAANHYYAKEVFFLGRNVDYAVGLEGSLKLKEISYIHSEAYAAGEIKHGTISLIEEGSLVIALATQPRLVEKMISNIKEVKARGAVVLALTTESNVEVEKEADFVLKLPDIHPMLAPSLAVIPLQLFGYYVASMKGCDIDKPRNLAKSVTVE